MRLWTLVLSLCTCLLLSNSAFAVIGKADSVPGATLLYPTFEVDLANTTGVTTQVTIQNASATAILAHVVLWTDLGISTVYFNVYLTGYDVQSFDVGEIFRNGKIPRTASAGQDPGDTISPKGSFSQDINFASCTGQLPYASSNALLPATVQDLRQMHSGLVSNLYYPGKCAGTAMGDSIARGYITVDTVNNCTTRKPGDLGYFANGGTGDATNQNVMMGDYMIVNPQTNFMQAGPAVSIEASSTLSPGMTFYGRKVGGTGFDNREPLPTAWGAPVQGGRSDLLVWRDPEVDVTPFTCGAPPPFYAAGGLLQNQIVFFDSEENATIATSANVFRNLSNRVAVNTATLPFSEKSGWAFLNFNTTVAGELFPAKQSWVTVLSRPQQTAAGAPLSTGFPAIQLGDSINNDNPILVPNP